MESHSLKHKNSMKLSGEIFIHLFNFETNSRVARSIYLVGDYVSQTESTMH